MMRRYRVARYTDILIWYIYNFFFEKYKNIKMTVITSHILLIIYIIYLWLFLYSIKESGKLFLGEYKIS